MAEPYTLLHKVSAFIYIDLDLELQGVKTKSQVSTPCYTAKQELVADEDENHDQSSQT